MEINGVMCGEVFILVYVHTESTTVLNRRSRVKMVLEGNGF